MEPLVSVIVPVYKVEPYLRKCVDSILGQTYRNIEVILVDDGSPDNCGAICDEYAAKDERVKVIHKENGGQSDARNAGLEIMTGEYLTFVDSDDWLAPDLYAGVMAEAPFDVEIFGCTFVNENGQEELIRRACEPGRVTTVGRSRVEFEKLLDNSLLGYACNKIYRKSVVGKVCFEEIPLREDLRFNLTVLKGAERVKLSSEVGYCYLQREKSTLHGCYVGDVPDLRWVLQGMECIFTDISHLAGDECANRIVKVYITDFIHKYIVNNPSLTKEKKNNLVKTLFTSKQLQKRFRIDWRQSRLFILLTLCYKLRLPGVFYSVMMWRWKNE